MVSLSIVTSVVIINVKHKNESIFSINNIGIILFSLSIFIIFSLTGITPMSGFHIEIRIDEISFIPFAGITEMLQDGITSNAIINIVGNIIMFMPFGFLAPLFWYKLDDFKKINLYYG